MNSEQTHQVIAVTHSSYYDNLQSTLATYSRQYTDSSDVSSINEESKVGYKIPHNEDPLEYKYPLSHIEAKVALDIMQKGANLLKHNLTVDPHLRFFQLSKDKRRIVYFSEYKDVDQSQIYFSNIVQIQLGQKSERFLCSPLPMLKHLSFTLYYKDKRGYNQNIDLT
jgi:hypothetical protein